MDVCSRSKTLRHSSLSPGLDGFGGRRHCFRSNPSPFTRSRWFVFSPLRCCTIILDLYRCRAKIPISGRMKTSTPSDGFFLFFLHDTDNILLPARLTFMTFRLAACRFTVSSLVLHFRGFLCAEAAPFVLVLRLSTALMS